MAHEPALHPVSPSRPNAHPQSALELVEDAIQLLRNAPAWLHVVHLLPSGLFVLAFLWFWSDMTRGVLADQRLASGAAIMALLHLVMKTAHGVHAAELHARCADLPRTPWTAGRVARLLKTQALLQPLVFILLPLSVFPLLLVPFPWLLAWFHAVSICGDPAEGSASTCARHAWRHAVAWPAQNHGVVGILLVVGTVVLLDVAIAVASAPYLAHLLLGIESDFNLGLAAYFNSTFLLSLPALAYLVLDPVVRAIYVLRGFRTDSIHTGADILARLRLHARSRPPTDGRALTLACLLALGGLLAGPTPVHAQVTAPNPTTPPLPADTPPVPSIDPERLGRDLRNVLDQAEYQWRAPRELAPDDPEPPAGHGPIRRWLRSVLKDFGGFANRNLDAFFSVVGRVLQFIFGGFKTPSLPSGNTAVDWMSGLKLLAYVLLAAAVAGLAWIILRLRTSRPTARAAADLPAPSAIPDLEAESVSAELLPEDGWLAMASEKAALGEWRLALRAVYLGALAHLARRELLRLAPSKSNREYLGELRRRARAYPFIPEGFQSSALRFEKVWYGRHPATPALLEEARADLESMRRATPP